VAPALQLRLAQAVQSIYDKAPTPAGWELLDREFVPADPDMPVSLLLKDVETGLSAKVNRGSITGWDWWQDFRAQFVPSPWTVGQVELGFNTYNADAKTESGRPLPPVQLIVGHSLGGPDSTFDMCAQLPGTVDLLLLESPQPGDEDFCTGATAMANSVTIWRNPNDVVPQVPPYLLGWRQLLGDVIDIDSTKIGVHPWDFQGNHSLKNAISVFQNQYPT
jgi:hypothetical protein